MAMDLLDFLSKGLGDDSASRVSGLTGENSQGTRNALWGPLASQAGIRPASATTLLSTLAPLVFGLLRGHAAREGLGASGLASLLLGQRDTLARRAPEGLASSLGWGPPSTWFWTSRAPVAPVVAIQPPWRRWLPWIVAALVAIWLLTKVTRIG